MATREEIIAAIQQDTDQVERIFGALSDEQLQMPSHTDEGGWTARQVLAHLAGRQVVNDRLVQWAADGVPPAAGNRGAGNMNQEAVDARKDRSRAALLAEFRAVQEQLIATVRGLSDDALTRAIPLPQGERVLSDVLVLASGTHALRHAEEVQQAIARSAADPASNLP